MTKILDVCIVDPSETWRNVIKEILCRELEKYGVTSCVSEFSSLEQLRQLDRHRLSYDLLMADISHIYFFFGFQRHGNDIIPIEIAVPG